MSADNGDQEHNFDEADFDITEGELSINCLSNQDGSLISILLISEAGEITTNILISSLRAYIKLLEEERQLEQDQHTDKH
jgi:hypothetical protein